MNQENLYLILNKLILKEKNLKEMSNQEIKDKLQNYFEPLGIVAYSECCRWGCTGSYDEGNPDFVVRKTDGLYFIRFHLDGMNYNPNERSVAASYVDHNYIMDNWESEEKLLKKFCQIIGLEEDEYEIIKPKKQETCIMIEFKKPLELQKFETESEEKFADWILSESDTDSDYYSDSD